MLQLLCLKNLLDEDRMKTVIVNGSPRKNWNTAQLLKEAQRGAEEAGREVTFVNLEVRESEFPKALQKAYEVGKRVS